MKKHAFIIFSIFILLSGHAIAQEKPCQKFLDDEYQAGYDDCLRKIEQEKIEEALRKVKEVINEEKEDIEDFYEELQEDIEREQRDLEDYLEDFEDDMGDYIDYLNDIDADEEKTSPLYFRSAMIVEQLEAIEDMYDVKLDIAEEEEDLELLRKDLEYEEIRVQKYRNFQESIR